MNCIWNLIRDKKWSFEAKTRLFLFLTTLLASAIGLLLWFALHFFVLNTITWAICFAGYPGFFVGLFGGIWYLYRHDT